MRPTGVEGLYAEFSTGHYWEAVERGRRARLHSVNYSGAFTANPTGNREVILTFYDGGVDYLIELLQFSLGAESLADRGSGVFDIPADGILFDDGIWIVADNGTTSSEGNTKGIKHLSLTVQM